MKAKKMTAYRCGQCDEMHANEQEAMECCPPEAVEAYTCGECGDLYEDREDAKECCK